MLSTRRRELCTRVLKRCRRTAGADQKTCASTCSAACDHHHRRHGHGPHDLARDLLCCQWPNLASSTTAAATVAPSSLQQVTIYRSQRSRAQQHEMMTAWKAALESSDALHAAATRAPVVETKKTKKTAPVEKECSLPMDMECGCKTKREKEAQEALALALAEAKRQQQLQLQLQQQQQQQQQAAQRELAWRMPPQPQTQPQPHHEQRLQRAVDVVNSSRAVEVTKSSPLPVQTSFHRRHLPLDCIAFSSPDGRKLFVEALNASTNYMQIYFPLAEQFITQSEPAYCGLSTLAMCLNAMQIDPGRLWKGAWRWFSEELFDCCTSLSVAKEKGISMAEFICLARCNGVLTDDYPADADLSLDAFREIVKKSCATNNEIVVLNYSRKVLGQTGDGHFSPIGGYHAERDMVLLLDVARFKYPPHWVKLSTVHAAMQRVDESSGKPRGLVVLKESAHATGPTLVKNMVLSADPSMPVKPAPQVCCSSPTAIESARHIVASPTP